MKLAFGKAFQKYKRHQGRAGQQAIHEFISKGKIWLDQLLLLLAVLEANFDKILQRHDQNSFSLSFFLSYLNLCKTASTPTLTLTQTKTNY